MQQVITWANVDPDLCHHMASLGHKEFKILKFEYLLIFYFSLLDPLYDLDLSIHDDLNQWLHPWPWPCIVYIFHLDYFVVSMI